MPRIADSVLNIRIDDDVQSALNEFDQAEGWTADKKKAFSSLTQVLKKNGYVEVIGDCRTYGLQTKGSAAIYNLPNTQTGKLRLFAGRRVRVVCLGPLEKWPGYSGRRYAVKQV